MGGDHCHNSTRARFSYSGSAISYSGGAISYSGGAISYSSGAISYSGRAISYSGCAVSYLGGVISLQLRNSTVCSPLIATFCYSSVTDMISIGRKYHCHRSVPGHSSDPGFIVFFYLYIYLYAAASPLLEVHLRQ